ncbi:MAG TPA: tail fiber domain-containing protein [Pyrinomonadaceae bacterium]|jgi:hypothetical protein
MISQLTKYFILNLFVSLLCFGAAQAQTTAFTYQGKLTDSNLAANGSYDMQFALFDAPAGGSQIGATVTNAAVQVTNGIFTVTLDYGAISLPGADRFLEISVRQTGNPNPRVLLAPRQQVTSAPYAVQSLNANTAINSAQLGGIAASNYVIAEDVRLSDARTPLPGSANYIQNTTNPQTSANFNISGSGAANIFNAATNYQIGGSQVLSAGGTNNIFGGSGAGASNTFGVNNVFFGFTAGNQNTTGSFNAFFGPEAGFSNTNAVAGSFFGSAAGRQNLGSNNAFFGADAGRFNTSGDNNAFFGTFAGKNNLTGTLNTFIGTNAGLANTIGSNNTLLGSSANFGANNLTFATAVGSGAVVNASNTVVVGRAADTVQIPGSLNITGTLSANIFNAGVQFNIGGIRMLSAGGTNNVFAGNGAGALNSSGQANAFFGFNAGAVNSSGSFNAFFGSNAGAANTTAINNSFFGQGAGFKTTTGGNNTFLGNGAGLNSTTAAGNTFVGSLAGQANVGGGNNTFLGINAGQSNVGSSNNTFVGANTANSNLTGSGNTFVGANTDGAFLITNATVIGQNAFANRSNATAIGANSYADQNNSLILGSINGVNGATSDTDVGIGTTTPQARLNVKDNSLTRTSLLVENSFTGGAGIEISNTAPTGRRWEIYSNDGSNSCCTLHFVNLNTNTEVFSLGEGGGGIGLFNGDLIVNSTLSVGSMTGGQNTSVCWSSSSKFLGTCSSSIRYKKDVQSFNGGFATLDKLNPVTFRWKSDNTADIGFVAEDVAKVEPLLATYNDKGEVEGVKYDRISAVLVNSVKEQQAQLKRQQAQIETLRQEISTLKTLITKSKPARKRVVKRRK